jgi:dUTP pyrophosphatase
MKKFNELGVYLLNPNAKLPKVQTSGSACFDLEACLNGVESITAYDYDNNAKLIPIRDSKIILKPQWRYLVPTGLIFDIPEDYSVRIHNRSSLPFKKNVVLANAEGVIDSDYVEEIFVMLYNNGPNLVEILDGDRIAQAEMVKSNRQLVYKIGNRPERKTERDGGIGSTGK